MSQYKPFRNCPVCESQDASFLKKINFMLFDKHPMVNGYNLVQCNKCGFLYADTEVTQADLDIYYTEVSKYEDKKLGTGGGFTQYDKDRLEKAAKFIDSQIEDKSIRVADIGCANGGLLKELKALGFTNLVAIDPSSACIEITKSEVGCESYQYSIFNISPEVGKFDLVILSHVLEHILEVEDTMDKFEYLLNDGGYVYVECPNAQNYSKVVHAPYQELNTEHINHFDEISFSNVFGLHGYDKVASGNRVTQIASGDDYHSVYGLFKKTNNSDYKIQYDSTILDSINEYIQKSEKIYQAIISKLEAVDPGKPTALLGIGQFAFKLLADPVLKDRKNILLFDNNSLNIGKSINNFVIQSGSELVNVLQNTDSVIIITSLIHEDDIRQGLTQLFKKNNIPAPLIIGFKQLLNN